MMTQADQHLSIQKFDNPLILRNLLLMLLSLTTLLGFNIIWSVWLHNPLIHDNTSRAPTNAQK